MTPADSEVPRTLEWLVRNLRTRPPALLRELAETYLDSAGRAPEVGWLTRPIGALLLVVADDLEVERAQIDLQGIVETLPELGPDGHGG